MKHSIRMNRRRFLASANAMVIGAVIGKSSLSGSEAVDVKGEELKGLQSKIDAHRPSQMLRLPPDFCGRVGATHVAGKYHLTQKPFLIEGAEKLLELGTQLGKLWFDPGGTARSYPFNSSWGKYKSLLDLAKSEYFQRIFEMPFKTIILESHTSEENPWKQGLSTGQYQAVKEAYSELTEYFYRKLRQRDVTVILQHWEGDWLLRGAGKSWDPPPADWSKLCDHMKRWLMARQEGVNQGRAKALPGAKCRVAHAAEVNRVADIWKGIPTMTDKVLPDVEMDLISYSAYDGIKDGVTLYRCIEEIRRHAKTGKLFGPGSVYIGEIGIPENEQPSKLRERWDELLGASLASNMHYVVHWELYCNELNPKMQPPPPIPITEFKQVRGFWLVRPDGSLSESGHYLCALWQRAKKG